MPRYIEENEIYKLFNARGVAQLHVGDIDVLPRAEVKEVVHGQWILKETCGKHTEKFHCSVCNKIPKSLCPETYCPNCGAKMEK